MDAHESIFAKDLEKVYKVTFLEYTNASRDTVSHNEEEMCYLGVGHEPFLVRESELEYYRQFGNGYDSIQFVGNIAKERASIER